MRIVPALLLILLLPITLVAQDAPVAQAEAPPAGVEFRAIGSTRPFNAEIITEVMFDHVGFLWIGTREGLFLYDGQRFRKFQHEVQNPDSITSNGIRGIFEDSRGRLWINTISGGLNLLDRASWQFTSWRHHRNDPESIVHDGVFTLAEAAGGKLWVGTQAGLDLFDPATGTFAHQFLATGGEFVISLLKDRDGRLWVATLGQGLFRQRADGSGFEPVQGSGKPAPLDVFSLAQAADGTIWAGARNDLYRIDGASGRIVESGLRYPGSDRPLHNVTALLPMPDGGLWIGTFGEGLYRLGADSAAIARVPLGSDAAGAKQIDSGALAFDRAGNLFVGTFGAGLLRANQRMGSLQSWREKSPGHPGLASEDVYSVLVEPAADGKPDRLRAGSFGGGIDEVSLDDGKVTHLALPVSESLQLHLSGITDLMRSHTGEIWATTNEGVYRWNRERGTFHYFVSDQGAVAGANPGYSFALLEDREQRIWIGSAGGGLYLHQPGHDTFRVFRPISNDPHSLPDDFVTALIEDRRGRLWIGTRSGGIGICRLDQRFECTHVAAGSGPLQISHYHITDLLEAPDGAIWVATAGGGLNQLILDARGNIAKVRRWTRNDGLDDDNVMAVAYGPDGSLWLTTHGGLTRLDLGTGQITNMTPADGLPTAVFNPKAALRHGARMYFGSAKGVVSIDPRRVPVQGTSPPTVIEAVSGLDPQHVPAQPAWQLDTLQVAWRTPFSLEFAVLGYDGGSPHFQYRLGATEAWTDLGDRGQLTLHALEPGRHLFEVRGRRGGYSWTAARPLTLDIVPPWWRRTGVQAAGAMLLLLAVFGGFLWRVRELETRNRELQRVHGLRELALAEAHTSQEHLQEAYEMLRRLTMRLEAAKEKERKHLARELHDEFGQALTSAKINLGLALARSPSGDSAARIGDTIGLIDRLIGQVRALSLDLRPPLLDEMGLVPALESYLHAVSDRSNVPIRARLDAELKLPDVAQEMAVFRIVQEAVTNALRHADAGLIEVRLARAGDGVAIEVRDDGRGFDAAGRLAAGGSGLGLFGMRERVHDLGGDWVVKSSPGQGTLVTAFVPSADSVES